METFIDYLLENDPLIQAINFDRTIGLHQEFYRKLHHCSRFDMDDRVTGHQKLRIICTQAGMMMALVHYSTQTVSGDIIVFKNREDKSLFKVMFSELSGTMFDTKAHRFRTDFMIDSDYRTVIQHLT